MGMDKAQESKIKHERVVEYLRANKLDGVLLGRRCNFSWYTCGGHNHVGLAAETGPSFLLVTGDEAKVLTNNIEATRLRDEEFPEGRVEVIEFAYYDPAGAVEAFTKAVGSMKVAMDWPAPGLEAPLLGRDFDRLRWQLTEAEKDRYRTLCKDHVAALEGVARRVQPGQSENHIAGMIGAELYSRDCNFSAVFVGADQRILNYRHPLPTTNRVEKYFMLIACAERAGLISSCTRLASFGGISDELAAKHRAVAIVDAALIGATRPGAKLCDIYAEGQTAYESTGHPGQWQLHHQGGPCGYLARDIIANPTDKTEALADQAFAWNPSITGTKSEDTILCLEDGPEILGMSPDWPKFEATWTGKKFLRYEILAL